MVQITVLGNAKQNPIPMNLPLQLLTPCPWTVHRLEGGWPVCRGSWSVGVGRSNPRTEVIGMGITHTHYGSFTDNFSIWDNTNLPYL